MTAPVPSSAGLSACQHSCVPQAACKPQSLDIAAAARVISHLPCSLFALPSRSAGTYSVEAAKELPFPRAGGATGSIR